MADVVAATASAVLGDNATPTDQNIQMFINACAHAAALAIHKVLVLFVNVAASPVVKKTQSPAVMHTHLCGAQQPSCNGAQLYSSFYVL